MMPLRMLVRMELAGLLQDRAVARCFVAFQIWRALCPNDLQKSTSLVLAGCSSSAYLLKDERRGASVAVVHV